MRIKIRKTKSGIYYIPSVSMKQLKDMSTKKKNNLLISKYQLPEPISRITTYTYSKI